MAKTVLLFGTFDGIHEGHRNLLQQAQTLGERIVIILARDETVQHVKGRAPVHTEQVRCDTLRQEPGVSEVLLGSLGDKYAAINDIKPDVIALGYDQQAFTDKLEKYIGDHLPQTRIVRLDPFHPELYKSSLLPK